MDKTMPSAHRPMRRKSREIVDRAEIEDIIQSERVMRLAMSDENRPFLVPVYYGYDGKNLYFHSASAGTKIDILKKNPAVCFEVCIDDGFVESDQACDFEAKHRTVIGFGHAVFLEDAAEKMDALNRIVAKFSAKSFNLPPERVAVTTVVRIEIETMTGKKYVCS